jgi:predicted anti-sigma-YlaC factor YlaD
MADDRVVTCREFVELVTDYLEGTLPPEKVSLIEEHLDLCEPCRVYLEQIRVIVDTLPDVEVEVDEPVPDDTRAQLLTIFHGWKSER